LFLWASDRFDCATGSSPLLCDDDRAARLTVVVAEIDRICVAAIISPNEVRVQRDRRRSADKA
jgi:hypothetical protein